ncbi:archaellin/type IV pilin N-terminal domain-containing protein [Natrinema sp. 74]|uniref:archaellin/type IV pilin N-terminal domain-containing protein n=1 Tax=Natrinema sp. 74 TaxID=3384159 RepID=UPI0038D4226E
MFEKITNVEERGQVGIGTLIVFIAMVLVAAIAAGVLINTAGVLQSQASDTGSETQEEVANQINVVHGVGMTGSGENITTLNLTIKKSAGSNAIDVTEATVQYTSDHESVPLIFGGNASATATATEFTTQGINGNNGQSLLDVDERMEIHINTTAIEEGPGGLRAGEDATIKIIDQSGATFTYGVSVPNTFGDKKVVQV